MHPALEDLRHVWGQQFYRAGERVRWRTAAEAIPPASLFIGSPNAVGAHYARTRSTTRTACTVHLTEVCEEKTLQLIINLKTTIAPATDASTLDAVHQALQGNEERPSRHLVEPAMSMHEHS